MNYNDAKIAMRALNLDGGEGSGVKGHTTEHPVGAVDERGRIEIASEGPAKHIITIAGNTYPHKEDIKAAGFKFSNGTWSKEVEHSIGLVGKHLDPEGKFAAERAAMQAKGDWKGGWNDTTISTSRIIPPNSTIGGRGVRPGPEMSRYLHFGSAIGNPPAEFRK